MALENVFYLEASSFHKQQQLDNFTNKLLERKVIIEQDRHLFNTHIKDFPINFEQLINYILTIYKLEIEKTIQHKISEHEETLMHIIRFLDFLRDRTNNKLNAEDICKILESFLKNRASIESALKNSSNMPPVAFLKS